MRYAPEHNEATREGILEAASRLFREHGIAARHDTRSRPT